ncbi:Oxidoreductase-like protein, N-terminal [Delftia tsuruhatensis]|uniref:oxidoreductase-like domain-containing protein n=1 Tax=Delftia tsuruhatensis TaxID=180282 RepID=UPI001E8136B4|nr:oxidoreductase-like domain-containing protein [Delftia tsuruhatensis]CAB5721421.1 Oxidoreductase-like protein, N-terminal [Delftia tsuruhatensis]CAC9688453.1 Oxidoreductase-like protein, N-terminal [Delftia tsuruhatensis]
MAQSGPLEQALSRMRLWQQRARAAGITLRETPPQPTSCCGRGCNGCVWEGFYDAVLFWCEDAEQALPDGSA